MLYPLASAPYSDPVLPASAATTPAATSVSNGSAPNNTAAASSTTTKSDSSGPTLWSHGGFSFKDLLDIVNPLQHIPVVGSVYRYLTGDEESGGARIVGDSLYGGPIGFGVSVVSTAMLTDSNGKDLGERVLADVFGPRDGNTTLSKPVVASATPKTTPANPTPANPTPANPMPANPTPANSNAAARSAASAGPMPLAVMNTAQPVAMNNLFRSAPPNTPGTPEQAFLAQTQQFQKEVTQGRGANGSVISGRPVPLELSSNLLPNVPAGAHIVMPPGQAAAATTSAAPASAGQAPASSPPSQAQAAAAGASSAVTNPNPIAQKMIDALNKYEQLKKQEQQQDSASQADPAKVDLSL